MSTMPQTQDALINFFESHTAVWSNDPAGIGLSLEQLTALSGATVAARAALTTAIQTRDAAKGATTDLHGALSTLRGLGGPAIAAIRAFAEGSEDPASVYALAQIPPRADPTPAPPPEIPTDITAAVLGDGTIRIRWKAPQPSPGAEVFTQVKRRLNGAGPFLLLGDTGAKTLVDSTVPAGTHKVEYMCIAKRGEQQSDPSQPISLLLGVPGDGEQGAGEGGLSLAA